jgi:hypothetical protein
VGTFLVIVLTLWFGAVSWDRIEAEAYGKAWRKSHVGFVTVAAVDSGNRPISTFTLVVFSEDRRRYSGSWQVTISPDLWPHARFESNMAPGRYSVIAVEHRAEEAELIARRNPDVLARLKARATSFTLSAGDTKTLTLTLSSY